MFTISGPVNDSRLVRALFEATGCSILIVTLTTSIWYAYWMTKSSIMDLWDSLSGSTPRIPRIPRIGGTEATTAAEIDYICNIVIAKSWKSSKILFKLINESSWIKVNEKWSGTLNSKTSLFNKNMGPMAKPPTLEINKLLYKVGHIDQSEQYGTFIFHDYSLFFIILSTLFIVFSSSPLILYLVVNTEAL